MVGRPGFLLIVEFLLFLLVVASRAPIDALDLFLLLILLLILLRLVVGAGLPCGRYPPPLSSGRLGLQRGRCLQNPNPKK